MYHHIGRKIKGLAHVIAWIGIIISVIAAVGIMAAGNDGAMILGIVVGVCGILGSWIGGFLLYGFGQLVDNSDKIADRMCSIERY